MNLLCDLLGNREERVNMVSVVIRIRMVIMWSWKNSTCSMMGEDGSWKDRAVHLGIWGDLSFCYE